MRDALRRGTRRPLSGVALALLVAACTDSGAPALAQRAPAPAKTARPTATAMAIGVTSGPSVAAHDLYASRGLVCAACHPCGGRVAGGHEVAWMDAASPGFHALSANRDLAGCTVCHGAALDGAGGAVSIGCGHCHDQELPAGVASWRVSCTMCHGGTQHPTGAPPEATWGSTSPVAVGAHASHVGTNPVSAPIACAECHVAPADALAPGHVNGNAAVAFAGPIGGQSGGTWNYPATGTPTCSSTYCHGDFRSGKTTNAPSWTGTNQAACGTCHNARPQGYLHRRHQDQDFTYSMIPWWPIPGGSGWITCDQCHAGIARSTSRTLGLALEVVNGSAPPLHVNGEKDVVFELGGTWTPEPFQGWCSNMACHPGETKQWPR